MTSLKVLTRCRSKSFGCLDKNGLPTASPKKWTGDPPMYRAFSRRQSFETHANWFTLIPPVHSAQPVDHRREQALISSGHASGANPIDHLGVRLHPSAAPRKEEGQETVQAYLHSEGPHEHGHERRQRILKQQRTDGHNRLLTKVAICPLSGWPQG